jgi:hypothetical protein
MHWRIGLARAGQVHPAVFQHPVNAAGGGGLAGVPPGGAVHRRARPRRQRGEQPGRDPGRAQQRDEPRPLGAHRRRVRVRDQFRITHQQERAPPGDLLQRGHRSGDLGHLRGPAGIGAVEDRDPAVPADRQPGLDLLQIRPAVLRMPHRGAGYSSSASGYAPYSEIEVRSQRPGDPVIIKQIRRDAVRLLHRPLLHPDHRRRRSQPVRSQRPNSATTGSAPSRFSSTRTTATSARAPAQSSTSRSCQTSNCGDELLAVQAGGHITGLQHHLRGAAGIGQAQ